LLLILPLCSTFSNGNHVGWSKKFQSWDIIWPSLDWYFLHIPRPTVIYLFNITQCVQWLLTQLAKRPCELLPSHCIHRPSVKKIQKIFFSETIEPIWTKLGHSHPQHVYLLSIGPFQDFSEFFYWNFCQICLMAVQVINHNS
jgi:hypothetical protein